MKRSLLKYSTIKNNEMNCIIIHTSLYYIYTEKKQNKEKDSFSDIVGSSYNIINRGLLEKGEHAFLIVFDFKGVLSIM